MLIGMFATGAMKAKRAVSSADRESMSKTGAVPSSDLSSPAKLARTVTTPTCESIGQASRAKSSALHLVTALGFPKTPFGSFTATYWAASGCPGASSSKLVRRSGCPPACVVEVVTSNDLIGSVACAGPAKAAASAIAAQEAARMLLSLILSPSPRPDADGDGACE